MMRGIYRKHGKRIFDLLLAIPALIVLLPVLAVIAMLVRIWLGSPVLFRQERPGQLGRPFRICKFRTMTDARDPSGNLLPDDVRLTRLGRFLRASSLDELPELWNVIIGQLSLVGPRPLMAQYLPLYTPEQARRHEVLPGITGWAQVNGRNAVGWEKRFALDVWYVDNMSLWLDIQILWKTLGAVFGRKGISAEGHSTMPAFEGSPNAARMFVIGAGGHGKVVVSVLQAAGIRVDAVYDDNPQRWGSNILGVPVRGPLRELLTMRGARGVIGVGDNRIRQLLAEQLPLRWINAVHPNAVVHDSAKLGCGTVVCAGAVVQPDVVVGQHVIINTSSSIDHDCRLGRFASVGPGVHLAGNVVLGDRCALGTASCVIPGVRIENDVVVGAGSVVIRNVPGDCTVVGNPARGIHQSRNDDRKAA